MISNFWIERTSKRMRLSVDLDEIDPGADPHDLLEATLKKIQAIELNDAKKLKMIEQSSDFDDDEDDEDGEDEDDDDDDNDVRRVISLNRVFFFVVVGHQVIKYAKQNRLWQRRRR